MIPVISFLFSRTVMAFNQLACACALIISQLGCVSASLGIKDISMTLTLNTTVKAWHNELVESYFGEFTIKDFEYHYDHVYECKEYDTKITTSPTDCTSVYFLLMFSCLYVDKRNKTSRLCGCGDGCVFNNSCCFDKLFLERPAPPDEYTAAFLDYTSKYSNKKCLPFLEVDDTLQDIEHVSMIDDCPNEFNDYKLRTRCLKSEDIDPAVYVVEEKTIYKNAHCAHCNGFFTFYPINGTAEGCVRMCNLNHVPGGINTNDVGFCSYKVQQGQDDVIYQSICQTHLERLDDYSMEAINFRCENREYALCKSYFAEVSHDWSFYSNPHCVKCMKNRSDISFFLSTVTLMPEPTDIERYSWNVYFINGKRTKGEISREGDLHYCEHPAPTIPSELNVVEPNKMFMRCIFKNFGSIFIKTKATLAYDTSVEIIEKAFMDALAYKISFKRHIDSQYFDVRNADPVSEAIGLGIARANFDESFEDVIEAIILTPLQHITPSSMYGNDLTRMFPGGRVCIDPTVYSTTNTDSVHASNECELTMYSDDGTFLISHNTGVETVFWLEMSAEKVIYHASECSAFHLNPTCALKILEADKIKVHPNRSITVSGTSGERQLVAPEKYLPHTLGVAVCMTKEELIAIKSSAVLVDDRLCLPLNIIANSVFLSLTLLEYI